MYSKENSKIKLYLKSNSGITESLNFGLKLCKGEWIARLDTDDLCESDRLKKQLYVAESSDKLGLVGSDAIFINKFDQNLFHYSYPQNHEKLKNNLLSCKHFFPHSSAFYNRELVESLGGYRERAGVSEDWDLWLRIARKKEIKNINEPLVKIRIHDTQVSKTNYINQAYDTKIVVIANLLNKRKNYDPLEVFTNNEFKKFKLYAIKKLENLGFNDYLRFISMVKNPSLKRITFNFIFIHLITNPLKIYKFIKFKFFSKNILINISENFHKKYLKKINK